MVWEQLEEIQIFLQAMTHRYALLNIQRHNENTYKLYIFSYLQFLRSF